MSALRDGIRALLECHKDDELHRLWIAVHSPPPPGEGAEDDETEIPPPPETREGLLDGLQEVALRDGSESCRGMLQHVLDGILYAYWASLGFRPPSYKIDMRKLVLERWREHSTTAEVAVEGGGDAVRGRRVFVGNPDLVEVPEAESGAHEMEVADLARRVEVNIAAEAEKVRQTERRVYVGRDYSAILDFLDALTDARKAERSGRDLLRTHALNLAKRCDLLEKRLSDAGLSIEE